MIKKEIIINCELCKKEEVSKIYEVHSNADENNIYKLELCDECYVNKMIEDWEDFE